MPNKRTPKPTIIKAHKIAKKIGSTVNPYAVGMAVAKKAAKKAKRKR